ncbi:MAG TPA: hypothetical protein C5S37_03090 [Methanophagales archaeon]|nr:hypothetical protein [Methanophagales archaeon]
MVLSHPSKTRIIAEAKIKTDKIDSKNLAKNGVKHEFSDLFGVEGRIFFEGDRSSGIAANCT